MSNPSVLDWLTITKTAGKEGWSNFYEKFLGQSISQPERFFTAVERFGHEAIFDAIIIASTKTITGDALNYVIGIAVNRITEEIEEIGEAERYRLNLAKAKQRIALQNEELEAKLEKAREINVNIE